MDDKKVKLKCMEYAIAIALDERSPKPDSFPKEVLKIYRQFMNEIKKDTIETEEKVVLNMVLNHPKLTTD